MKTAHEALEETVYKLYKNEIKVLEESIQYAINKGKSFVYFDELMDDNEKRAIAKLLTVDNHARLLKADGYSSKEFDLIRRYLITKGYEIDNFLGRVTGESKGEDARHCLLISW